MHTEYASAFDNCRTLEMHRVVDFVAQTHTIPLTSKKSHTTNFKTSPELDTKNSNANFKNLSHYELLNYKKSNTQKHTSNFKNFSL